MRRYFVTPKESSELCLMSALLGDNRDVFFPKLDHDLNLITFSDIAERYLENIGLEPVKCETEDEARSRVLELKAKHKYPVYFFKSDTTGEKDFEEFYTDNEILDMKRFDALGVIKNEAVFDESKLQLFTDTIGEMETGNGSRENGRRERDESKISYSSSLRFPLFICVNLRLSADNKKGKVLCARKRDERNMGELKYQIGSKYYANLSNKC